MCEHDRRRSLLRSAESSGICIYSRQKNRSKEGMQVSGIYHEHGRQRTF
jgi:hypothetical protein